MIELTADQIEVGLRALKTVAAADGVFGEDERALVLSAASLVGVSVDADALGGASPEDVERVFPTPELRLRVLQAMVVMALVDGEATDAEVRVLERFRTGLGVDDGSVKAVRRLAGGHLWALRFDLARRLPILRQVV